MTHIHAAAMAEYAKDALETNKPWERWEFCHMRGEYQSLHSHPEWVEDNEYRRKPQVILINGHEVPELRHQHTRIEELEAKLAATNPTQQGLDARDAAFEAVRKAFCNLQRYSFWLDSMGNVRRCADRSGNWVEFEAAHTLFEPQSVDAALAAQAKQGEKE